MSPFFMESSFYYIILMISSAFSLLPLIIFYISKKENYFTPIHLIIIAAFIFEILSLILSIFKKNLTYISQIYTIIEFSLVCHYYISYFKKNIRARLLYLMIPIYVLLSIYEFIYKNNGNTFENVSLIIESIFFIVVGLLSFVYLVKYRINELITDIPFFWVNSGILVYFSGNILLFLFYKTIEPKDFFMLYVYLHSSLNILYNILLCVSIYKLKKG